MTNIDKSYDELLKAENIEDVPKIHIKGSPELHVLTSEEKHAINEELRDLPDTAVANIEVNPVTGNTCISSVSENGIEDSLVDSRGILEILDQDPIETTVKRISTEKTFEHSLGDIGEKDILAIISFIRKVEKERPKKLYALLPEVIKKAVDEVVITGNKDHKEMAANEFYTMIKNELSMDQKFIDFDMAIKKELEAVNGVMDVYVDHQYETMTTEIEKTASKIEEKEPSKAKLLRDISKTYKEAIEFKLVTDKIENKGKDLINKQFDKDLKNDKKLMHMCKKANAKYKHSKYTYPDTRSLYPILDRRLSDDIPSLAIKKFIMLLLQTTNTFTPDNILEHTYMYYSVKSIESLDHVNADTSEIIKNTISKIESIIRNTFM